MQGFPRSTASVGAAVAQAESDLLFGREADIQRVCGVVALAREHPVVAYLHGAAGAGKTVLLRACISALEAQGLTCLLLDGRVTAGHPAAILQQWARALSARRGASVAPTALAVAEAMGQLAQNQGLLLVVDHYEELVACDAWLRNEVIYRLGPGVAVVLAGRRGPDEVWPGDRAWRRVMRDLPLREFTTTEAMQFLRHCGVHDEAACVEVLRLAGTSPSLLGVAADAVVRLAAVSGGAFRPVHGVGDDLSRPSALLEQMLHPGSRRRAWRAGLGDSTLDRLVAAASVVGAFHRDVLGAMVGPGIVEPVWPQLTQLPFVFSRAGHHALHPTVHDLVRRIVGRLRPWAQRQWQHRALAHYLERLEGFGLGSDGGSAWEEAVRLAVRLSPLGDSQDAASPARHPSTTPGDTLQALATAEAAGLAQVRQLLLTRPEMFRTTRTAAGRLAGWGIVVPPGPEARDLLMAHPGLGAAARLRVQNWLSRDGQGSCALALDLRAPATPGVCEGMVAELCSEIGTYDAVAAAADPETGTVLELLGLRALDPSAGDGEARVYVARFSDGAAKAAWLRRIGQGGVDRAPTGAARIEATREALLALHDEERLRTTALARHLAALRGAPVGAATVRAVLLDALVTADLGKVPTSGRDLLMHYYVQRTGAHESVAEDLGLSRATYFRWHRRALAFFGDQLFT